MDIRSHNSGRTPARGSKVLPEALQLSQLWSKLQTSFQEWRSERRAQALEGLMRPPPVLRGSRQKGFGLEAVEPRILLSADITYGSVTAASFTDVLDGGAISSYLTTLGSTDFTLKVVNESGSLWWR